jgi:hypothetical protein
MTLWIRSPASSAAPAACSKAATNSETSAEIGHAIERHRRTVLSSAVEILPLSKSPTPIGMLTTIDPYCSWVGASRSILKR